jgi:kumamolisin
VGKSTTTRPTIAVISLGGSYRQSDLDAYWKLLGFVGADIPVVTSIAVVASNNPAFTGSGEDLENTLDLEIVGGICRGSNIRFYKTPNTDLGFYQAIDTAINGVSGVPPNVISISWGAPELYYSSVTLSAMDQLFALAKSKGIIVCAASGDDGSSDGVSDNMLHVDFPASSSNVLACGGTSLVNPLVETGWSWNTSSKSGGGGGQSSVFKRPAYQVITSSSGTDPTLIPSTVTLGSGTNGATANTVNLVNRTVPDISLNADPKSGWSIFFNGKLLTNSIGGTSCVAPCVAGYFASLRLPTSITSLIHENIYQIYCSKSLSAMFSCPFSSSSTGTLSTPTVKPTRGPFKDITIGNNDSISALTNAYSSAVNYDCVTGIGSFDGSLLFAALSSLTVRSQQKTNNTSSELKKIDRDIDKMDKKQKVLQTTQLKNRGELEEIFMEIEEEQILEEILDQNGFPAISETIKKRLAEKKEEVKVEKVKVEKVKVEKKVEKQKKEKKKGIFSKLFK